MPFKFIFHVTKPDLILLILAMINSYRPRKSSSLSGRVAGTVYFILNNTTSNTLKYCINSLVEQYTKTHSQVVTSVQSYEHGKGFEYKENIWH